MATSFTVNKADLEFILRQIKIAERTSIGYTPESAPVSILQAIMEGYGLSAADATIAPFGLRTVDGSYNSLIPGHDTVGAADTLFPRLTDPVFRNEGDDSMPLGPGAPVITNNNYGQPGSVADADPRIISNLIVDMSISNPAAVNAFLSNPLAVAFYAEKYGYEPTAAHHPDLTNEDLQVIPNQSPDIGLSPGFNAWMTFFGQFFDHGLDLVTKGNNGNVYIPLAADDPLIAGADGVLGNADDLPENMRFMVLTRATATMVDPDGSGPLPAVPQHENTTTSFVDQNQTYTSNSSHQVFLREYVKDATGHAVSTGRLLDGTAASGSVAGAIGNWNEVKAQALEMLGIQLSDFDVHNVPLLLTDQYGKFIPGPNGYAQLVMAPDADHATNWLKEGTAAGITTAGSIGTNHAFLNDIAHHASPSVVDHDHDPATPRVTQGADADIDANRNGIYDAGDTLTDVNSDGIISTADFYADDGSELTYDDEMLGSHFITGDGRGNENIALTTVHSIFHSEHNRLVDVNKATILASGDIGFINEWLLSDLTAGQVAAIPTDPTALKSFANSLSWDGERLFQAARFATEMQYQHLVFEEFARRMQPMVDPFTFNSSPDVNPAILAEFAHTVYRFGHSMLTGTVDRLENDLTTIDEGLNNNPDQKTLLAVFLNPQAYIGSGADLETINANIIRGLSRDVGNAIDEFIVNDVRSNLLGLPLDLAALNIARGRDAGIPSLNEARAQLYNDTGIADLKPYSSWADFALNIKNAASVVNFIAAYGTHASISGATTIVDKRAAAEAIVFNTAGAPADRLDFLNATGAYAAGKGGLDLVDMWIGGLAEKSPEFGGMLGTTFNYVFEFQMESLQFGDRMYYLTRTQGTNFLNQLEPNTFSDLVMRNTELGDKYATHLNGALFTTPDHIIELDRGIAQHDYNGSEAGRDPTWDGSNPVVEAILGPKVVRNYAGATTVDVPATSLPSVAISNGGFEQDSLATGAPGVISDALGNYTTTAPSGWTIIGGVGGLFAPASTVTDPAGHDGNNVVWLHSGAKLSKNTAVNLVQGAAYSVTLKVGDRTDQSWPGGTARLMASDGVNPAIVLATVALPTPADGQWSTVVLETGAIANAYNGFSLFFEVEQADGSGNQILIDDVAIAADYAGATVTHDVGGYLRVQGGEHYVLGGTEGDDTIIGDKGIDTLWGDGGDDYLNGMTESDDVFGGEGDDIIEDPFGDDVLRGNQGNDVITSARGADLLFGDQGKDYVVLGQDASEVFGGTDNDFILGGAGKDFLLGNEGDDWMEGGGGFDTLAGDNSELFFNSPIIGHDVMFGHGDENDYDAESGDDIMGSGPSVYRYEGMFGFDWGIAKYDVSGVKFDLQIPIFTTIPADVLRDRFDQVEALSGWQYNDILDGDDRGHSGGSSSPDSTPVELFVDHTLDNAGIDRITGLRDLLGLEGVDNASFKNGNVLIGGGGNDFLRGRGGFDVIDGDSWLNVRIKIVVPAGPNAGVYSAESMTTDTTVMGPYAGKVFNTNADGSPDFERPAFGGASLTSLLLDRTLNPGQLSIIREILDGDPTNTALDTAVFQGGDLEYEIEGTRIVYDAATGEALRRVNIGAPDNSTAPLNIRDVNGDGFITVRDLDDGTVAAPGRVGGLTVSRGALTDDTDRLVNIERLQFADKTLTVGASNNSLATGTVTISDPTPFDHDGNPATPGVVSPIVGQVLTATLSNLVDLDGVPIDPATGMPVGLTFEWQTTEAGNDGGWATISTGLTYTVRPVDPSHVLRAVAVFQDSKGVTERIASMQTDNVTAPFSVNENSASGTVIGPVPFSLDYDPLGFGGTGVTDGDVVQLTHVMSPGQDAGGRFAIINTGTSAAPVYQLVVANGGAANLNYEDPANPDHAFEIIIDTYTDTIANGGQLMATRQFTVKLSDVEPEIVAVAPTDIQWNGVTPGDGIGGVGNFANGLPGAGAVIANLATTDADTSSGFIYSLAAGSSAGFAVSPAGVVTRTGSATAPNTIYTLNVSSTDTTGATRTETFTIKTGTNSVAIFGPNGVDTLNAGAGDSVLYGSGANDTLNGGVGNDSLFGQAGDDGLVGAGGNDILAGGGGTDTLTGGAGGDTLNGGAGTDAAIFVGPVGNYNVSHDGTNIVIADNTGVEGADTLSSIETLRFNGVNYTVVTGTGGNNANMNTPTGAAGSQAVFGLAGNDTINGGAGDDLIDAGDGDDTITQTGSTGGRDQVDGGAGIDTFVLNGVAGAEAFIVYTRNAATAAGIAVANLQTEIVVTRGGVVIAELDDIEEIVINSVTVSAGGGNTGGQPVGDTVQIIGNFAETSLNLNTITIDGTSGNDVIDISSLQSAHRIVFKSNGGNDTIVGTLRPQDVIELPDGMLLEDYDVTTDENGVTTMTSLTHSIFFTAAGDGLPQFTAGRSDDDDDEDDDGDDDGPSCGCDDEDDDGPGTPAPNPNPSTGGALRTGTAAADVLIGTADANNLVGLGGDDTLTSLAGEDAIAAGEGADFVDAGEGRDVVFAGAGDDQAFGRGGADMLYGEGGNDRIFGGAGNDLIDAGAGNDTVLGGSGNDQIVAATGDGDDTYFGDESDGGTGTDTLDYSAITANLSVDLGNGLNGRGSAASSLSGSDTLWSIENVATGSGSDTITASDAVNVMEGGTGNDTFRFLSTVGADGDTILDFQPGDRLDLSAVDADASQAGNQSFTLANGGSFSSAAQLSVTYETRADGVYTVVKGNVDAATDAEFQINLKGSHNLTPNSFIV